MKIASVNQSRENYRVQKWVVAIAFVLFALKITAYFLTHSVSILTDALESIVNVIAGMIGLFSLYVAAKPSDDDHPYGHGKAEFISAALEGILILVAGLMIIYEAIYHLLYPVNIKKIDYGIVLLALSGLINYGMGFYAIRKGKKNKSLALEASGRHLQSDTYATLAVIGGLVSIFLTGIQQIDSIVAIGISVVIVILGYRIARRSVAGIMDEADKKILSRLIVLLNLNRRENWIDIHNLRVIKFGPVLHIDCHLTVPWYMTVRESHLEIDQLSEIIVQELGESMEFFVHADDCNELSCSICLKQSCNVRLHPFTRQIEWTLDNIIKDKKHALT